MKPQARFDNYFLYRERQYEDIPWVRPTDFQGMALKHPIVLINGAFDILHAPHMRLIFAARHKAGTLVCALDSDDKVRLEKGQSRPVLTFIERAASLNYMPLDFITEVNNTKDMNLLMASLKPDLRVQSIEYRDKPSRYKNRKMFVREGKLHTSLIVDRILENNVRST